MNKPSAKRCAVWILVTEAAGFLSGFLNREGTRLYAQIIEKPPLSPPAWVFPVAWALLYALMGAAAARIANLSPSRERSAALRLYGVQLAFNFLWSFLFFGLRAYGFAFFWLAALFALIVWTTLTFRELDRPAGYLLLPYLVWVAFAGYLNAGVWMLN